MRKELCALPVFSGRMIDLCFHFPHLAQITMGNASARRGNCRATEGFERHASLPLPGEGACAAPLCGERSAENQVCCHLYGEREEPN